MSKNFRRVRPIGYIILAKMNGRFKRVDYICIHRDEAHDVIKRKYSHLETRIEGLKLDYTPITIYKSNE